MLPSLYRPVFGSSMHHITAGKRREFSKRSLDTITTIDTAYMGKPTYAAAYMIEEGDRVAFIDNNTNHAIPDLLKTLAEKGKTPDHVDYLIITHLHFDHAAGTGLLSKHCPNAKVLAHPVPPLSCLSTLMTKRAGPHLVDPSRLINGVKAVYGQERFNLLYGDVIPVEEDRIQIMSHGETLTWGERELVFLHTRGHAKHHFVIHDKSTSSVFTGDAFGISYLPFFKEKGLTHPFLFPSSSPVDFEPEEAHKSVDLIVDTGAERVFPTHFGAFESVKEGASWLHSSIDKYVEIQKTLEKALREGQALPLVQSYGEQLMRNYFIDAFASLGFVPDDEVWEVLETDIQLNAQGLISPILFRMKREDLLGEK